MTCIPVAPTATQRAQPCCTQTRAPRDTFLPKNGLSWSKGRGVRAAEAHTSLPRAAAAARGRSRTHTWLRTTSTRQPCNLLLPGPRVYRFKWQIKKQRNGLRTLLPLQQHRLRPLPSSRAAQPALPGGAVLFQLSSLNWGPLGQLPGPSLPPPTAPPGSAAPAEPGWQQGEGSRPLPPGRGHWLGHSRARAPSCRPVFPAIFAGPASSGRWRRTRPCGSAAMGASPRCRRSSPWPVTDVVLRGCLRGSGRGRLLPLAAILWLFVLWAGAGKEELRQNSEILGLEIYFISVCALQTMQTMPVWPSLHCGLLTDPLFPCPWAESPWGSTFWKEPMEAHHRVTLGQPEERFLPETPLLVSYRSW